MVNWTNYKGFVIVKGDDKSKTAIIGGYFHFHSFGTVKEMKKDIDDFWKKANS